MQTVIQLTPEEYENLLKVQQEPDIILRQTNTQLKQKLDECTKKLEQGSFDTCKLDSPFMVVNNKLCFRSPTDFVIMYNNLAGLNLGDSDAAVFTNLQTIAQMFNYDTQFEQQSQLKAYRVSLQKKGLYQPTKVNGKQTLTKQE